LNRVTEILIQRLEKKGLKPTAIPRFLRIILLITSGNNDVGQEEMNRQLHLLGWDTFELDDRTLRLILASLEAEGLIGAENKSVQRVNETYKQNSGNQ
jgi:hypothetical protein